MLKEIVIPLKKLNIDSRFRVASNGAIDDTRPNPIPNPPIDRTKYDITRTFVAGSKGDIEDVTVVYLKTQQVSILREDSATLSRSHRTTRKHNL